MCRTVCRLALYVSLNRLNGFKDLLRGFVEASVNDFVLDSFRRGRRSHDHGWGFAYVYRYLNDLGSMYFRTSLPIKTSVIDVRRAIAIPRLFDWIAMVLHSRLTSGEPIDISSAHPFYVHIPGRLSLWLVHNGAVDKKMLAGSLSMDSLRDMYADSYFLAHWIANSMVEPSLESFVEAVEKLISMGVVRTSLNMAAILVSERDRDVTAIAVNYVCGDGLDVYDYYKLYRVDIGGGAIAIASSTVALYMARLGGYEIRYLENGEIVAVKPGGRGIEAVSKRIAGL